MAPTLVAKRGMSAGEGSKEAEMEGGEGGGSLQKWEEGGRSLSFSGAEEQGGGGVFQGSRE